MAFTFFKAILAGIWAAFWMKTCVWKILLSEEGKNEKKVWGSENKTLQFYQPWSIHQRRMIICILQWKLVKIQSIESRCGFLLRFFLKVRVAKTSWEQRPQANTSQRTLKVQGTLLAYKKSTSLSLVTKLIESTGLW